MLHLSGWYFRKRENKTELSDIDKLVEEKIYEIYLIEKEIERLKNTKNNKELNDDEQDAIDEQIDYQNNLIKGLHVELDDIEAKEGNQTPKRNKWVFGGKSIKKNKKTNRFKRTINRRNKHVKYKVNPVQNFL